MANQERDEPSGGAATAVKEKGEHLVSEAQQQVQEKAGDVRDQASLQIREQVDRQSTTAGDQIHAVGKALRRSSEQLRAEGKGVPATAVEEAAKRAETFGRYLRDTNADRIIGDVESFARRRPWLTGAAGLVAGFVASRFLRASSQQRYDASRRPAYAGPGDGRQLAEGSVR